MKLLRQQIYRFKYISSVFSSDVWGMFFITRTQVEYLDKVRSGLYEKIYRYNTQRNNDYSIKKKKKSLLVGCSKKEKDFAENNRIVTKYHSLIFKVQVKNPP